MVLTLNNTPIPTPILHPNDSRILPPFSLSDNFLRFSASSAIVFLGLTLRLSSPAFAHPPPPLISTAELGEEEKSDAAFDAYKSKVYALSLPLTLVALRSSTPPSWLKEFLSSQGKRVKLHSRFSPTLQEIFYGLSIPLSKTITPKSTLAADIVTVGDSWLHYAVKDGLIQPLKGVEDQDWYQLLSEKWKVFLRRNPSGDIDPQGETWAVPYRWGTMVIAYKAKVLQKQNLAPIEDWGDLWRPELAGRISMVNCPREVIGAVLKYMGATYNTKNIDTQVAGGRDSVQQNLALLSKQVRLFDSTNYLKAFSVGDVWVSVGWSSDVLPVVKRMSNVTVIVPKSGASLWADLWAIPAASRLHTDKIGGRVRGPSPLVHQWMEFCLQAARVVPFIQQVIPGAAVTATTSGVASYSSKGKPRLDTNLIAGVPPPDILARCEFLEPLGDTELSDYIWLIRSIEKPNTGFLKRMKDFISSAFHLVKPKTNLRNC